MVFPWFSYGTTLLGRPPWKWSANWQQPSLTKEPGELKRLEEPRQNRSANRWWKIGTFSGPWWDIYNVGPPQLCEPWLINILTIVISTINQSYWSYKPTERYRLGAPHCNIITNKIIWSMGLSENGVFGTNYDTFIGKMISYLTNGFRGAVPYFRTNP